MKKITVYILLLLLLSSICSCLDDKNNYDYTPVSYTHLTLPTSDLV